MRPPALTRRIPGPFIAVPPEWSLRAAGEIHPPKEPRARMIQARRLARIVAPVIISAALTLGITGCAITGGNSPTYLTLADIERAKDSVKPSLVRIHAVTYFYSDGKQQRGESTGSGAIISADGLVVTNHHVAANAARLFVTMPTKEELPAELIGTDAMSDIAVIRILPPDGRKFPVAQWGDSDQVKVGDPVFAMGSPLSLSQSVTLGIVSNNEMILPQVWGDNTFDLDGEDVGSIVRWIGHDATIQPGNSGGPLVDRHGKIIGVNEMGYGSMGGAIPANLARQVADELITKGRTDRAYLGMLFQPLLKSQASERGVLVSSVLMDSPAEQAGIVPGDFLVAIGGKPVEARFAEEIPLLNLLIAGLPIGESSTVTYVRSGEKRDATITPVRREEVFQPITEDREWGITVRNLTIWTSVDKNRENRDGVLVTSVRNGGPASTAKPSIDRGDIITKVNGTPVRSTAEFIEISAKINNGRIGVLTPVVATIERDGKEYLTVARVGVEDLPDPSRDVVKPWVPLDTQVLTKELAKELKLGAQKGVRVVQVYGDAEREKIPFKVGDLIIALDGDPVQASESHDSDIFDQMIRLYRVGTKAAFTVLRDGEKLELTMELPARPPTAREMRRYRDLEFGFTVREVTYYDRQSPTWQAGRDASLLVDSVERGGVASLSRMNVGDKLLEIGGAAVTDLSSFEATLKDLANRKAEYVVIKVQRGPHTKFLNLEPVWK